MTVTLELVSFLAGVSVGMFGSVVITAVVRAWFRR